MRRITALSAVLAAALVAALTGCTPAADDGASPSPSATPVASATATDSAAPSPSATAEAEEGYPLSSFVAQVDAAEITLLTTPEGDEEITVRAEDVLTVPDQTPFVFLVKEIRGSWVELYLPIRPNGSTGWAQADDVSLSATQMRVEVSLEDFELSVFEGDQELLTTPIGLGQDELPTPGGVYYIRELLAPPDPDGIYGPYAYGLSGYSPVLDEFAGGDAVIGMHGTNDPDSIGGAVSHGCIRLPNDAITELVEEIGLPLGTPVYVEG